MWSYPGDAPLVLQALDLVVGRRPARHRAGESGRKGTSACVGWLYSGLQR